MKQTIYTLILVLATLASCTNEHEQDTGTNGRDPITIASNLAVTTLRTRAEAATDFFRDGDVIRVVAQHLITGTVYETYYSYNKAGNTWNLLDDQQHLYLQDVYDAATGQATHEFTADFYPGWPDNHHSLVTDQSTPEGLHRADEVGGDLELDAPSRTLSATEALSRTCTKLTIEISPGQGWEGQSLPGYLETCEALIYRDREPVPDVIPYYIANHPDAGKATYTVILPPDYTPRQKGNAILALGPGPSSATTQTHTLRLDETITPKAGEEITITAALHISGELKTISVEIGEWKDIPYDGGEELVGLGPALKARQKLIEWNERGNMNEDFTLEHDVDLTGYPWEPVGNASGEGRRYTGTFNGNNHTISGLTPGSSDNNFAFFGSIGTGGRVENLKLADTRITKTTGELAGIAVLNYGQIADCEVEASVHLQATDFNIASGGIAVVNFGKLTGCNVAATVTGHYAGGIASTNSGAGARIDHCTYTGSAIEATQSNGRAGGIVATNTDNATVQGCTVGQAAGTGTVTITSLAEAGGIAAVNEAHITGCNAYTHTIEGSNIAGGIAGINYPDATLTGCHSRAATLKGAWAGGIAGDNTGKVAACHTGPGQISATEYAGGIAGRNAENGFLIGCYSLATGIETSDANYAAYAGGITGLNRDNATHVSCHYRQGVTGTDRGIGVNNTSWDYATQAFSYSFADMSAFYAGTYPDGSGGSHTGLLTHMNHYLDPANNGGIIDTRWRWQDASGNQSAWPTLYNNNQ